MSIDLDHKLSVLAAAEEVPDAVAVRSNGTGILPKRSETSCLDSVTRALTRLLPVLILRR